MKAFVRLILLTISLFSINILFRSLPSIQEKHLEREERSSIHMIVPHFKNLFWLPVCLESHIIRLDKSIDTIVTVITMENDPEDRLLTHKIVNEVSEKLSFPIEIIDFPFPDTVKGGSSLKIVLEYGLYNVSKGTITTFVDSDTVALASNWNKRIVELFDSNLTLEIVGINPRHRAPQFRNVVEWNWMSVRTKFFISNNFKEYPKLHDHGHSYSKLVTDNGGTQILFPSMGSFCRKCVGQFCGNGNLLFAYHSFYGTRTKSEGINRTPDIPEEKLKRFFDSVLENKDYNVSHYVDI
jgi:hypothetical protein